VFGSGSEAKNLKNFASQLNAATAASGGLITCAKSIETKREFSIGKTGLKVPNRMQIE